MKTNNCFGDNQSVRPSISEIADALACSYEIENLAGSKELYTEMCRIIADVLTIHPDCIMRIAGQPRTVRNVQEMYALLTGAHLEMIEEKLRSCSYEIKNRVAWLRTALYNAPMEYESYCTNQIVAYFGG